VLLPARAERGKKSKRRKEKTDDHLHAADNVRREKRENPTKEGGEGKKETDRVIALNS